MEYKINVITRETVRAEWEAETEANPAYYKDMTPEEFEVCFEQYLDGFFQKVSGGYVRVNT